MVGLPSGKPFTRLIAVAGAVTALLLTVGCGSQAAPAPSPSGGAPAANGPVTPKVNRLVWALKPAPDVESSNIRTFCCFSSFLYRPSHEDLINMDGVSGKYVPGLATEWNMSADYKTITFKLRENVPFQGGGKWGNFSSEDVIATEKNIVDNADTSFTWANTFWKRVVKDMKATAPNEVVFTIEPDVNFFLFMSPGTHQLAIRSKKQLDAEGDLKGPVEAPFQAGTGPYEFAERKSSSYLRFKRVPYTHWNGNPDFPEFEFRFVSEPSTRLAALLAGEVQVTDLPSDLSPQAEKAGMKSIANRVPAPRVWGSFRCCYLDPQTKQWPLYPNVPLLKKEVREALNRAINRDELAKAFAPKGRPMYVTHFDGTRQAWDSTWEKNFKDKYGYDTAKAKDLLAQAGYTASNPLKIQVMAANLTYIAAGPDIAESIAQYWRAVGVQPEIVTMDTAAETTAFRAYKFENVFRMQSASATLVDGIDIFSSGWNPPGSGYWTPEFMDKLRQLNGTLDTKKQDELLKWIGDFGFNEYWDVPLWYVPLEVTVNPKIVADYTFPGFVHGGWSHFETLKAAR